MTNKFSPKRIDYLLKAKTYEKHGLSKQAYIKLCQQKWEENNGPNKVIVDKEYPLSIDKIFRLSGYHLDYGLEQLLKDIKESTKENDNEFLSCLNLYMANIITGEPVEKIKVNYPDYWSDSSIKEGKYFLAYFDVLGFTKLVESKSPTQVYKVYENILRKARINKPYLVSNLYEPENADSTKDYLTVPMLFKVPFKYAYYSDTILFWAPGEKNAFSGFIAKCIDFYNEALRSRVLLRGVISYGDAILNKTKNIFIGKPIIEASNLEKEQKWSGLIFGSSIYENYLLREADNQLLMYAFPYSMKRVIDGKIYHVAMNWAGRLNGEEQNEIFRILKEIKYSVPEKNRDYLSNTIRLLSNYYSLHLPDKISNLFSVSMSFPKEIKDTLTNIRSRREFMFKVVFLELKTNEVLAGYIFVVQPKTFEENKMLKDALMFVEIRDTKQYFEFLIDNKSEEGDIRNMDWIIYLRLDAVEKIYTWDDSENGE